MGWRLGKETVVRGRGFWLLMVTAPTPTIRTPCDPNTPMSSIHPRQPNTTRMRSAAWPATPSTLCALGAPWRGSTTGTGRGGYWGRWWTLRLKGGWRSCPSGRRMWGIYACRWVGVGGDDGGGVGGPWRCSQRLGGLLHNASKPLLPTASPPPSHPNAPPQFADSKTGAIKEQGATRPEVVLRHLTMQPGRVYSLRQVRAAV